MFSRGGFQTRPYHRDAGVWIPACAGMTDRDGNDVGAGFKPAPTTGMPGFGFPPSRE